MGDGKKVRPGEINGSVDSRAFVARLKLLAKHGERSWGGIPILDYVTISFDGAGTRMKVARRGIDLCLEATLDAEGSGATALPAKTLLAFVSNADGDTISFTKGKDDDAVVVKCGRYNAALYPLDPDDAPTIETPDVFARGFPLPEGVLSNLLTLTKPFVSTEETRYYLNGVCFELEAGKLRAVACDGRRLGTREAKVKVEAWEMRPIVPRAALDAISGIIGAAQCIARFHGEYREATNDPLAGYAQRPAGWYHQIAQFSSDGWAITTKLIDGNFPDWRRVVPQPNPGNAFVSIYADDVRRYAAMIGGARDMKPVKISPNGDSSVKLSGKGGECNLTGEARAEVGGTFAPIGVNAKYLATMAKAFGTDWLNLDIADSASPILMRGKDSPDGEFAILMPMRV